MIPMTLVELITKLVCKIMKSSIIYVNSSYQRNISCCVTCLLFGNNVQHVVTFFRKLIIFWTRTLGNSGTTSLPPPPHLPLYIDIDNYNHRTQPTSIVGVPVKSYMAYEM